LQNRKHHVAACRADPDYCEDIKFMKNGNEYSIAAGGIASDGAGSVQAYNHLISGSQHALIVFSLQTGKPLRVKIDQISCFWCQRKFTKVLQTSGKKACEDLNDIGLSHDGRCFRNSKYSPAQAEEYACEAVGKFFFFDKGTNNFKASDETFFVIDMATDGDTHGAVILFKAQEELLRPYNVTLPRKPRQLPDIGHFIKTVSNGLYSLGYNNTALKGASLLEPSCIRTISSDVSKHLRT
jgi:hypothetical protein